MAQYMQWLFIKRKEMTMIKMLCFILLTTTSFSTFASQPEYTFEELSQMTSDERFLAYLDDEELIKRGRLFASISIASCTTYPVYTIGKWILISSLAITVTEAEVLMQRLGITDKQTVNVPSYGEILLNALPHSASNLPGALCMVLGENARLVHGEAIKRGLIEVDTRSFSDFEWGDL